MKNLDFIDIQEQMLEQASLKKMLNAPLKENDEIVLVSECIADEDIEQIVYEIEKTRVQMKALEEHEKLLKEELKELVGNAQSIKDHTGWEIATWKASYSNRFDTDAFKKAYPNIYNQFLKQTEKRTFITKRRRME